MGALMHNRITRALVALIASGTILVATPVASEAMPLTNSHRPCASC